MNTLHLIRAYSGASEGLLFRLRLTSPSEALAHRLQHGPAAPSERRPAGRDRRSS